MRKASTFAARRAPSPWTRRPCSVVEPSGAGDAFAAGLAVGMLEGWELERKARFASVMGGSACTALGCADGVFTRAEADAFLAAHPLNGIQ